MPADVLGSVRGKATTIDSVMSLRTDEGWLVRADGFVPKERYTSRAFADLELERLWSKVWQIAGREEELAAPGDYVEYEIGDESVLVVPRRRRRDPRVPQRVPAPWHPTRRGRRVTSTARASSARTTVGGTRSTAG